MFCVEELNGYFGDMASKFFDVLFQLCRHALDVVFIQMISKYSVVHYVFDT